MKNLLEIEERITVLKILRDAGVGDFLSSTSLIEKINQHSNPSELSQALSFFCTPGVHQDIDSGFLFSLYSRIIQAEKPFKMATTLYILKTLFRRHIEFFLEPQTDRPYSVFFFTDSQKRLCYEIKGRMYVTSWIIDSTLDMSYLESRREQIIRQLILNADIHEQSDEWVNHDLTLNICEHPKAFIWALVLSKFNHLNLFQMPERLSQLSGIIHLLDEHFDTHLLKFQLWMEMPREHITLDLLENLIRALSEGAECLDAFCQKMKNLLAIDVKNENFDCLPGCHINILIQKKEFLRMTGDFGSQFFMSSTYDSENYFDLGRKGF